jgi:hypothetical protein
VRFSFAANKPGKSRKPSAPAPRSKRPSHREQPNVLSSLKHCCGARLPEERGVSFSPPSYLNCLSGRAAATCRAWRKSASVVVLSNWIGTVSSGVTTPGNWKSVRGHRQLEWCRGNRKNVGPGRTSQWVASVPIAGNPYRHRATALQIRVAWWKDSCRACRHQRLPRKSLLCPTSLIEAIWCNEPTFKPVLPGAPRTARIVGLRFVTEA